MGRKFGAERMYKILCCSIFVLSIIQGSFGCNCKCGVKPSRSWFSRTRTYSGSFESNNNTQISEANDTRIISPPNVNAEVSENEFPWLVALVPKKNPRVAFCGGVLLSSKSVLTAAHCRDLFNNFPDVLVRVGAHDLTKPNPENTFKIKDWKKHFLFEQFSKSDYDFAVIELDDKVKFSHLANPICMPDPATNYDAVVATVAGWGYTDAAMTTTPDIANKVDVDTMSNSVCQNTPGYGPASKPKFKITDAMICARRQGSDACRRDSGGPLMTKQTTSKGESFYSLIGIVSTGKTCGDFDSPGVYGRVTKNDILKWIKDNTKGKTCGMP